MLEHLLCNFIKMKNKSVFFLIAVMLLGLAGSAFAQHDMKKKKAPKSSDDAAPGNDEDDEMTDMADAEVEAIIQRLRMVHMTSGLSLNLPVSRDGSGTAWQPDATPVYGYMLHTKKWMFMFNGNIFARYEKQDITNAGHRGGDKWDAPDMLMAMAQRKVGHKGVLHFNAMFSTDALIDGGNGYPLLFQTGESWQGQPLVDRQHPQDMFSELSASYSYALSKKSDLSLYAAYPGEPALGPVTFMHRASGEFMPDAPIGHHWEDATHITFGVATLGFRYGRFKIEGSSFTGREPDEDRYNFDPPLFDSWSGRLSYNPTKNWSLQVSHGFIKSPEALNPDENVNRNTASATYVYPIYTGKYVAATALWGQNMVAGQSASSAALLEATLKLNKLAIYSRYEWVQKTSEELVYDPYALLNPQEYNVSVITLGAGYDLFTLAHITVAGGIQGSVNMPDAELTGLYGKMPLSGEVYLHFHPALMN